MLVLLYFIFVHTENALGAHAWQEAIAEVRAAGEPADVTEIVPPPVPNEENFAALPIFRPLFDYEFPPATPESPFPRAIWRDPEGKKRLEKIKPPDSLLLGDWEKGKFADLEEATKSLAGRKEGQAPGAFILERLAEFEPAIEAIRAGAGRPYSRFPHFYENLLKSPEEHRTFFLRLGMILRTRTMAELSLGDTDAAAKDMLLILRLAEAMREEPTLISQLFHQWLAGNGHQALWEGLARRRWTEPQLAALELSLRRIDLLAAFQQALRGERLAFCGQILETIKRDPAAALWLLFPFTAAESHREILVHLIPPGWIDFSRAHLTRAYLALGRCVNVQDHRVYPQQLQQLLTDWEGERQRFPNPRRMFANLQYTTLHASAQSFALAAAKLDLARVAIALERHRLAHGQWPQSLEALAPAYLPAVPLDLISGEPLRYRPGPGEAFTLYSIGWNRRDDGGLLSTPKDGQKLSAAREHGDWAWPQAVTLAVTPR